MENLVVGEKEPYEYLVKSIDNFINQNELLDILKGEGSVEAIIKFKWWNCSNSLWMEKKLMIKKILTLFKIARKL